MRHYFVLDKIAIGAVGHYDGFRLDAEFDDPMVESRSKIAFCGFGGGA